MDRKFYTDDFERLLKEKSDEFRIYPTKRVWHSIYNNLHPGKKWPSVAMSMLLILALLLIGYLNSGDNASILANISDSPQNNQKDLSGIIKTNSGLESKSNPIQPVVETLLSPAQPVFSNNNTLSSGDLIANDNPIDKNNLTGGSFNTNNPQGNKLNINNKENLFESLDYYIKSNRIFADIALANKKKNLNPENSNSNELNKEGRFENNPVISELPDTKLMVYKIITNQEKKPVTTILNNPSSSSAINNIKSNSTEEKAWIEDYALHNKAGRNKWKERAAMEIYASPSIGFRKLNSNISEVNAATTNTVQANKTINQKPSIGLEAGLGLSYSLTKNIVLKGGLQLNYTNYGVHADQTNHPILTTLLMNDPNTGNTFMSARTSTFSNTTGLQPVTLHNKTYQFSLPVGFALKLAGNSNISWYVGASIQPTFVIGGTANLISSDYKNYISDPTLLRKWNMNSGFETYINYKLGGYKLQVGPQFRYQMMSTYNKKYTFNENLYNTGIKIGLVKGF